MITYAPDLPSRLAAAAPIPPASAGDENDFFPKLQMFVLLSHEA
jgi:hypothetical protein